MTKFWITLLPASSCDLLLCSGVMFKMIWSGALVRDHNLRPQLIDDTRNKSKSHQIKFCFCWNGKQKWLREKISKQRRKLTISNHIVVLCPRNWYKANARTNAETGECSDLIRHITSDCFELYKREPMTVKSGSKIAGVILPAFLWADIGKEKGLDWFPTEHLYLLPEMTPAEGSLMMSKQWEMQGLASCPTMDFFHSLLIF